MGRHIYKPQSTQGGQQPPRARRGQPRFLLRASGGAGPASTLVLGVSPPAGRHTSLWSEPPGVAAAAPEGQHAQGCGGYPGPASPSAAPRHHVQPLWASGDAFQGPTHPGGGDAWGLAGLPIHAV